MQVAQTLAKQLDCFGRNLRRVAAPALRVRIGIGADRAGERPGQA